MKGVRGGAGATGNGRGKIGEKGADGKAKQEVGGEGSRRWSLEYGEASGDGRRGEGREEGTEREQ